MKTFKEHFDLMEGVNDPSIFKAVFLAGGPGSGKSFTVGKTGLTALGFKIVNSDDKFEAALKKADLEPTPDNIFSPKGQKLRGRSKELTAKQRDLYIDGRLGLVIDGTGKNFAKIKKQSELLKAIGYDVAMIFVNTDQDTALIRNRKRSRSLPDAEVETMWKEVQNNLGKFQSTFGSNFVIVDNSEGSNIEKATTSAYKKMSKFAKDAPKNNIAKKWISKQLGEATWKSEGHYTADGKEWTGDQHQADGQVMTGKVHSDDSVNLYHFKELSPEVRKKISATFKQYK